VAKRYRDLPKPKEWENLKTDEKRQREERNQKFKSKRKRRLKEKYGE
jgi:hypothetical protein